MPETSADLLRRAATKIRNTAASATPGPWEVLNRSIEPYVSGKHGIFVADPGEGTEDADYIALWHPGIATLVADMLAADASGLEGAEGAVSDAFAPELALARAILGDTA